MDDLHMKKVLALDPKTNVEESWKPQEVIMKGGIEKSRYVAVADSASATNFQWNSINPSSLKNIVERSLRVRYKLRVTVVTIHANIANRVLLPAIAGATIAAAGDALVCTIGVPLPGPFNGCLRNFPLQSCAVSIEVKINGKSTSVNSSEFINNYSLMMSDKEVNRYVEFPAQPDSSASYAYNITSSRSPFAMHDGNSAVNSRASYLSTLISSVNTAAAGPDPQYCTDIYEFEVVEQLIVSPFTYGDGIDTAAGLSNIDNISLNINLDNVYRCLSTATAMTGNPAAPLQSLTVSFLGVGDAVKPALLYECITPDPVLAQRMPPQLIYTYENIKVDKTQLSTINISSGAPYTGTADSGAIRASSIPDKLFVYVKASKSTLGASAQTSLNMTNAYLNITNITMQWGNGGIKFSSYTEYDLYKMSVANGLKVSW